MLYDKDIREPLAFYLEEIYGKNRILEEQVMGQSRADMVMVVHDALTELRSRVMRTVMHGWIAR